MKTILQFIRSLTLFVVMLIPMLTISQTISEENKYDNKPVMLTMDNTNRGVNNDSTWMHYDDVEMYDSWGFMINGELYDVMAKWDPIDLVDYEDWAVSKVKFIIVHDMPIIKVKIWEGNDGVEIYSQDVPNYNVGAWTEVVLDEPVDFDHNSVLMVGYEVDMTMTELGGAVTATDDGPPVVGYGNLYRFNGGWYSDFNNHNLRVLIELNFDAEFTAENTNICHGDTVDFINMSSGAESYLWTFEGGDPSTSTLENPSVRYETPGMYDVTLEITKEGQTNTEHKENYIRANEIPTQIEGEPLVCDYTDSDYSVELHEGSTYTWEVINGNISSGQGTNQITVSWMGEGVGEVLVTEGTVYNCQGTSEQFEVIIDNCTGIFNNNTKSMISIVTNPVSGDYLTVHKKIEGDIIIQILDSNGKIVHQQKLNNQSTNIEAMGFEKGMYFLRAVQGNGDTTVLKFIRN